MDVSHINEALSGGELATPGLFPHLEMLRDTRFVFKVNFGLDELPEEPGLILIRGARQYGKSTWLEGAMRKAAIQHGPGSAFYLNGDELKNADDLVRAILAVVPAFTTRPVPKRLFIDEITAVSQWESGLKRLIDRGELRSVLVVTTGSKATDLRRGSERLPGRKGKLTRTSFHFTPVSYREFLHVCGDSLGTDALPAYLLSGGCPIAASELASVGRLSEFVPSMIRDWILGEFAASGRSRPALLGVMECLHRFGTTPLGQAKLAREAGLANNTVAAGYVELLADLACVGLSHSWDASRKLRNLRRPAKFHFINLLAAVAWHRGRPRAVADFRGFSPEEQGKWYEWLMAQELWRRACIRGDDMPEIMAFWQGGRHEVDFVSSDNTFVEVKRGRTSPLEFSWFPHTFPSGRLLVIGQTRFETDSVRGVTFDEFLLDESWE